MDTTDTKAKTSMKKTLLNFVSFGSFVVSVLMLSGVSSHGAAQPPAASIHAARIPQNPLITVKSSPTLGDNVNGPAIIRVPSWVEHPLGRYYMYFAHHMGTHIRLAYADAITGPWHVYDPGVLEVKDTAFYRPQPDPPENLENFYTHVASPEVFVDDANKRFLMLADVASVERRRAPASASCL